MPHKLLHIPPRPFLVHKGIVLYQCFLDDNIDTPDVFVFTTNPMGTDSTHPEAFHVQELDKLTAVARMRAYPDRAVEMISTALVEAIEAGFFPPLQPQPQPQSTRI